VNRALVTFAVGDHERLAQLSRPRMAAYAERHGYRLETRQPSLSMRPPSWMKVAVLLYQLDRHREVLWLDADVVVCDDSRDIADDIDPGCWQGLVAHHTPDGEVPNCGVWYVRQPMRSVLERLWRMDRYLNHPWWEQAGMLDLLGYRHQPRPVQLERPTELYERTCFLGLEWNSHEERDRHPAPRFAHATAGPLEWRANVMRDYLTRQPLVSTKEA
jgi:hypothetical protein